jgi:hypothetical protein
MLLKRVFLEKEKVIFLGCLLIFCLLLFRDVFSQRTLIPNFEPFPDTFHYVVPARNFVQGEGFVISRENRILSSNVGPLYSMYLIPFYLINIDSRMFYFANIILALLSLVIFYKILKKICPNIWINGFSLFLFSTNYYIFWFPSLAMAENLLLFLFIFGANILLLPVNNRNLLLAIIVSLSLFLTKFSSIPLTVSYLVLYLFKILFIEKSKKYLVTYLEIITLLVISSCFFLFVVKQVNIFQTLIDYLSIFKTSKLGGTFSMSYFSSNLPLYINVLIGSEIKVLWDMTPVLPRIVAIFGLAGLVLGVLKSKIKYFSLCLISFLLTAVLFMSTFYSFDGRYIIYSIPILILGFNIFLFIVYEFSKEKNFRMIFYLLLFSFFLSYLLLNGVRLKKQIMLNIKYSETPWYYISVLEMNKYFSSQKVENSKKPILISAMAPFLIDFFSNNNYFLLPLSYGQEFRNEKETIWGPNDYSDLINLYKKYINDGYQVYVDRYGLGNEVEPNRDYKNIEKNFKLTEVSEGCYGQCNIYKLSIKDEN